MELSIQERLKNLPVERGLTLEQFAEQAVMVFICKRLKLNYKKLSGEEKKCRKKIAEMSDLLKNPNSQRGRK